MPDIIIPDSINIKIANGTGRQPVFKHIYNKEYLSPGGETVVTRPALQLEGCPQIPHPKPKSNHHYLNLNLNLITLTKLAKSMPPRKKQP